MALPWICSAAGSNGFICRHTYNHDFTIELAIGATTIRDKGFLEELWASENAPWANAAVPA
jgi:hypothetical protein